MRIDRPTITFTAVRVAHGRYRFYVRAFNAAGADLTPASAAFRL
jgi:hypothetical protein